MHVVYEKLLRGLLALAAGWGRGPVRAGSWAAVALLLLAGSLPASAQSSTWQAALAAVNSAANGTAIARATAIDPVSGRVYVAGNFTGQVGFGPSTLGSLNGDLDAFVARWDPATGGWLWALSAGGVGIDLATSVAASGGAVYVTGYIDNDNLTGTNPGGTKQVQFGSHPLPGTSPTTTADVFVARVTDPAVGVPTDWAWALAGGGSNTDIATGVAVSGNAVYVVGNFNNTSVTTTYPGGGNQVSFGTKPLPGLAPTIGQDVFVARVTDPGTSAPTDWAWALAAGGTSGDQGTSVAASGGAVYVAGTTFNNNVTTTYPGGANQVRFGTKPLPGATATTSQDGFVARLTDPGTTAPTDWAWAVAVGGINPDQANAVAVAGGRVYVAGYTNSNNATGTYPGGAGQVHFGSIPLPGVTATVSNDAFVARLSEAGGTAPPTWDWALAGGGTGADVAFGLAVTNGAVYAAGYITNNNNTATYPGGSNQVRFGTKPLPGATSTSDADPFVARLTDPGTTPPFDWDWALAGGTTGFEQAYSVAARGTGVYVAGNLMGRGTFGTALGSPVGPSTIATLFTASVLDDGTPAAAWQRVQGARVQPGAVQARATAVDAATGRVYVAGYFTGQVDFGASALTSAGGQDAFVARWDPATSAWAWALPAGGAGADAAQGIAAQGGAVYVAGSITNNNATSATNNGVNKMQFGSHPLFGASATTSLDAFVARLTDPTSGVPTDWAWALAAGGTAADQATAVATTGGAVYVAGATTNDNVTATYPGGTNRVQFGTKPLPGASATASQDAFVARVSDPTSGVPNDWAWALAGGGTAADQATGVAATGNSVYVAGSITNNNVANATNNGVNLVQFGTRPLPGASATTSLDAFVAKATDPLTSAPTDWAWALAGGGTAADQASGVAVRGAAVYVAGSITGSNVTATYPGGPSRVQFGTRPLPGASPVSSADAFVAKVLDPLTAAPTDWAWALAGGGTSADQATGVAATATAVYTTGFITNDNVTATYPGGTNRVQFGTRALPGTSGTLSTDAFVARATDPTSGVPTDWALALAGGGSGADQATGIAVQGTTVYTAGYIGAPAAFGSVGVPNISGAATAFAASLVDNTALAVLPAAGVAGAAGLLVFPNPAPGLATLGGAAPGAVVQVLDALGRLVLSTSADAAGHAALRLPAGLVPGVYVVRSGGQAARLVVE